MAQRPLLLLLLSLAVLASANELAAKSPFDLYLLVRSFSPTFCKQESCSIQPLNAFTLHGLWPEFEGGGWPQFCGTAAGRNASASSVMPLANNASEQAAMECEWPSFRGPNSEFWGHEWDKHGTCAEPLLGERDKFFGTVLDLNQKYDVDVALEARGIMPSSSRTYATIAIERAIHAQFGVNPVLHCYEGAVLELWMCMSLDLKPRTCPPHVVGSCGALVHLPKGDPVPRSCQQYFPNSRGPSWFQLDEVTLWVVAVIVATTAFITTLLVCHRRSGVAAAGYAEMC